jgi:hypothetical protein
LLQSRRSVHEFAWVLENFRPSRDLDRRSTERDWHILTQLCDTAWIFSWIYFQVLKLLCSDFSLLMSWGLKYTLIYSNRIQFTGYFSCKIWSPVGRNESETGSHRWQRVGVLSVRILNYVLFSDLFSTNSTLRSWFESL